MYEREREVERGREWMMGDTSIASGLSIQF